MGVSPFSDPFLSGLLGDDEIAGLFAADAEMAAMLAFETALARAQGELGVIPAKSADQIAAAIASFKPDTNALSSGTARDGVVVPELVRQLRKHGGKAIAAHIHFGATSQDVVDSAFTLRCVQALDIFSRRLDGLARTIKGITARDGGLTVMAHTRMQRAVSVPASRIIGSWLQPLLRHRARLDRVRGDIAVVSLAGAAGTLDKLGDKGESVRQRLGELLGLAVPHGIPHSERDAQAVLAGWLAQLSGSLGKIGQDIVLHAQNEVGTITLGSGGGSSAMPHKVNPVGAEVLVSLARFNATLVSGANHALVHEYERSGAAWMLEWMLLPQMLMATAAGLRTAESVLSVIRFNGDGTAA